MLDHDLAAIVGFDAPNLIRKGLDRADGRMAGEHLRHLGTQIRFARQAHRESKTMTWATILPAWLLKLGFSFMAKCRMPARSAIKS